MRYLAVKVAYMGEGFAGSQRQPGLRTVESDIIRDICAVLNVEEDTVDLRMAGRTDKGVNALGNVAVFNTDLDAGMMLKALNAVSDTIYYRAYFETDEDFYPRFADRRIYRYEIPSYGIDIEKVRECVQLFIGTHDFKRFCKADGKPTVDTIDSIDVVDNGSSISLIFSARYFLWNLIRRISSAAIKVGRGSVGIDRVMRLLEGENGNLGLARADALTLVDTIYDDREFIPVDTRTLEYRKNAMDFALGLRRSFLDGL